MNEAWNYKRCVLVLNGEIEVLKKISAAQSRVRQAVIGREWVDFDGKVAELEALGLNFNHLENERAGLFSGLADEFHLSDGGKPFYALIMPLPPDESRELSRLYRELKMESLKMKAMNETFLAYLNEAKTMAAAYLEAVCPARGGKLYTRMGRRVSQDLKSIVFNNRF